MAVNLKTRLEKLEEAATSGASDGFCIINHGADPDCHLRRAEAIADYERENGCKPTDDQIKNVVFIDPATKRPICGCKDHREVEVAA